MAMKISDIFNLGIFKEATLVAGENGLTNEIIWINVMEILDVIDSLQKGELLVTTGYELDNIQKYKGIIYRLKEKELAGIAIQPGYYIDEIPQFVIDEGMACGFPVIKIPKKITFSHITRTIYTELYKSEQTFNEPLEKEWIIELLDDKNFDVIAKSLTEKLKFNSTQNLYICIFDIEHKGDGIIVKSDIFENIKLILDYFDRIELDYYMENIRGRVSFVLKTDEKKGIHEITNGVEKCLTTMSSKNENLNFTFSISAAFNRFEDFKQHFYQALNAEQRLKRLKIKCGLINYDEIDLLMFYEDPDQEEKIKTAMYKKLSGLIESDKHNKTEYVETLEQYLRHNCSIVDTSNSLFVHRHTLKYRLNKIQDLCDINFESYRSRMLYDMIILYYKMKS